MFDFAKLSDISKNYISHLTADEVYSMLVEWANKFDIEFCKTLTENPEYSKKVLNIDRENPKPRKDIAKWSEVKDYFEYMFYGIKNFELEGIDETKLKDVIKAYKDVYNENDDKETWFKRIKDLAPSLNFATDNKAYKNNPEAYNGDLRETESLGISEENGRYYIHNGGNKQEVTIGIAGESGVIYYQDDKLDSIRQADGHGSPGTPYLIIPGFLNLNNKSANYPLKLNPRRIDRNTATLIARLMQALAKGYATKSLTLESLVVDLPKDIFNIQTEDRALTIGDLLEDLIYWGNRTRQNDPDPSLNKEYLKSKQLYIDFRRGQVRYGSKEVILGDTEEEMNKFINWIVNNKSFSIDRSKIFNHKKMEYTYSIEGGYSSVRDRDYVSNLLDNRVITTNLNQKGPLFKGQFIRLKTIRSTAPVNPVETPKPTNAKTSEPTVNIVDNAPMGVVTAVRKGNTITGAKVVKKAIEVAVPGTTLTVKFIGGDTAIRNENDNVIGDLSKIQFKVENGTINGIKVNLTASLVSNDGVKGAIFQAIKAVYPGADLLQSIA